MGRCDRRVTTSPQSRPASPPQHSRAVRLRRHEAALDALLGYTGGAHAGYCSTQALAECYATLTALPLRRRVLPAEARQLVEEGILERLTAVPLTRDDYVEAVRRVSQGGFAGGVVYDALHVCCAERIPVDRILTCNLVDFERLEPEGIVITAP